MGGAHRKNRRTARKDHDSLTYDYEALVRGLSERRAEDAGARPVDEEVARVLVDLKSACLAANYSLTHLARDLGVGYQAVLDWFAGRARPNECNWQKILNWMQDLSTSGILAMIYEGFGDLQDFLRLARSVLYGKSAGLDTTTGTFRDLADLKDRITATLDEFGNRSAVTIDPT